MYNKIMKKLSAFLMLALLLSVQLPSQAGFLTNHKTKIEHQKIYKTDTALINALFGEMAKQANKHNLIGLQSLYSKDFVNSDGFDYETYMKMVEETWKTYPDITYTTQIQDIDHSDNYASVLVAETAVANPIEQMGNFETIGELYSVSKCIYHLQKQGTIWLITSETVLDETSTLKYGNARHMNIELDTPNQVGAEKFYTASLKLQVPENFTAVASIGREKIEYPQTKTEENFKFISNDNILERIFLSNTNNRNEYAIASVALAQAKQLGNQLKIDMAGLAFVMTRVNVIPKNSHNKK